MKRIARSAIVERSAAQIYALVDDIEAYPSFLPWCVAARVEVSGVGSRSRPRRVTRRVSGFLVIHVLLLLACAAVIYLACEWFVNAVEWLGQRLKVGPLAVG